MNRTRRARGEVFLLNSVREWRSGLPYIDSLSVPHIPCADIAKTALAGRLPNEIRKS